MRRALVLLFAVSLVAATAATAFAAPPNGKGPGDHVPPQAGHACKGLETAFTAPAQGIEHMPSQVAAWLWEQYTEICE